MVKTLKEEKDGYEISPENLLVFFTFLIILLLDREFYEVKSWRRVETVDADDRVQGVNGYVVVAELPVRETLKQIEFASLG